MTSILHRDIEALYYIKNQQDATLAVLFISHCKITLHVSDAFCVRNILPKLHLVGSLYNIIYFVLKNVILGSP